MNKPFDLSEQDLALVEYHNDALLHAAVEHAFQAATAQQSHHDLLKALALIFYQFDRGRGKINESLMNEVVQMKMRQQPEETR